MLDFIDFKWGLAILSALISIGTVIYYVKTIRSGKIKPHMFTWLIWGVVTVVVAATQITSKGGAGSLLAVVVAINCFVIAGMAFFSGERNVALIDRICLIGCLIAISLWPMMKDPLLSLVIVTVIDTIGFYPTLRKSYKDPHEENLIVFFFYGLAYLMSVFAMSSHSLLTLLYPVAIGLTAWAMVGFLAVRRHQLGHKIIHERQK